MEEHNLYHYRIRHFLFRTCSLQHSERTRRGRFHWHNPIAALLIRLGPRDYEHRSQHTYSPYRLEITG